MAKSRYIYKQQGPWPQPNPLNFRLFPAVLHMPLRERFEWNVLVGLRYARQMLFYTPVALWYGLRNPTPRIVSDHEFEERFDNTVFNKMIVPFVKISATAAEPEAEPEAEPGAEPRADKSEPQVTTTGPVTAGPPPGADATATLGEPLTWTESDPPPQFQQQIQQQKIQQQQIQQQQIQQQQIPQQQIQIQQVAAFLFGQPLSQDQVEYQLPVQETQKRITDRQQQQAAQLAWDLFPDTMAAAAAEDETRFFIADFSIFEDLPTFPGTYTAGTTALFKRDKPKARLEVVAIRINKLELTPEDGDAWKLAKLFVMQGATIRLVFSTHALLHFPEDSINAISKDRLPRDHVLFQLLYPHTDLQLVLDKTVQTSFISPLINHQIFPWCAHTGPSSGLVKTLEQLYLGVEGNPAYPPYHYKHPRRTAEEKYVNFLEAYYQTILKFVRKVLAKVTEDDEDVKNWADYVAQHVPGFPDSAHIFEPYDGDADVRNLDWAVATFIWDVSVGHTTDHYNMGLLDINENPFRIRVPPPTSKDARFDPSELRRWSDFFRYRLFWRLFLTSTTVYRLDKVRYPFDDEDLKRYNDEFLLDLERTAKSLERDEFIPLDEIARSVQF